MYGILREPQPLFGCRGSEFDIDLFAEPKRSGNADLDRGAIVFGIEANNADDSPDRAAVRSNSDVVIDPSRHILPRHDDASDERRWIADDEERITGVDSIFKVDPRSGQLSAHRSGEHLHPLPLGTLESVESVDGGTHRVIVTNFLS